MASAALRFARGFLLLALFAVFASLCACRKPQPPGVRYESVRKEAQRGELDTALRHAQQAFHEYSGKDGEWASRFRVLNAHILVMRGSNSEALELLKEDLPAALANSETAVRRKFVGGIANDNLQQYEAAEKDLKEAEELARSYQPALLPDIEQSRGQLEMDRGQYTEAEADFQAALASAREQKLPFLEASALGSLGNAAMMQEHFGTAIDWYKKAQNLAQSINMQSSVARALGSMGWSRFELGDFEGALSLYQQGVDLSRQSGLVADRINWLTGVAESQVALHNLAAAEDVLQQAWDLAQTQDDKRIRVQCLNDLSVVMLGTDRVDLAQKYNQQALELERRGLDPSEILDTKMLTARIDSARREYSPAEQLFQEIINDSKADQASRWEAQAHLAKMYEDQKLPAKAEEQFAHSMQTIQAARASIHEEEFRLSFLSSSISFYGEYVDFLIAQGRPDDALALAEQSRAGTLEEGLRAAIKAVNAPARELRPQEIAKQLRSVLLFYWVGQRHSYLWAITPTKTVCLPLPPASEIDPAVKSYGDAVAESEDVAESREAAGEKLFNMLVAPARKFVPLDSRVILLPDGNLYALNFETLIVPEPEPHFWIKDVTLTIANSLSLLASGIHRAPPKQRNLLLIGDALKASDEFEPLPHAQEEMRMVQNHFPVPSRKVLSRERATPGAYLGSNPERFAFLHFVTHGTASRARPLESAVVLSKEGASDSFKLYARDIVTRHLNAEMVTISACNGSGLRNYSGEGVVGLSWAFLRAGAHNVIGALWEVSDAPATAQLMDKLYSGLDRGEDPASALRAAKLSLLRSASVYKKPFYWAPFQLYAGS